MTATFVEQPRAGRIARSRSRPLKSRQPCAPLGAASQQTAAAADHSRQRRSPFLLSYPSDLTFRTEVSRSPGLHDSLDARAAAAASLPFPIVDGESRHRRISVARAGRLG